MAAEHKIDGSSDDSSDDSPAPTAPTGNSYNYDPNAEGLNKISGSSLQKSKPDKGEKEFNSSVEVINNYSAEADKEAAMIYSKLHPESEDASNPNMTEDGKQKRYSMARKIKTAIKYQRSYINSLLTANDVDPSLAMDTNIIAMNTILRGYLFDIINADQIKKQLAPIVRYKMKNIQEEDDLKLFFIKGLSDELNKAIEIQSKSKCTQMGLPNIEPIMTLMITLYYQIRGRIIGSFILMQLKEIQKNFAVKSGLFMLKLKIPSKDIEEMCKNSIKFNISSEWSQLKNIYDEMNNDKYGWWDAFYKIMRSSTRQEVNEFVALYREAKDKKDNGN